MASTITQKTEYYVRDTVIYVGKEIDRSIPRACPVPTKTKRKPVMRADGEVFVRKVTPEEMERLWK